MKHLKTFEKLNYDVGDIVVCADIRQVGGSKLKPGKKYKVTEFSTYGDVQVEDLETGEMLGIYDGNRFETELDYDTKKYNI